MDKETLKANYKGDLDTAISRVFEMMSPTTKALLDWIREDAQGTAEEYGQARYNAGYDDGFSDGDTQGYNAAYQEIGYDY
jgi:flagellar biosynthesis/type III secretory pathway protein FliH